MVARHDAPALGTRATGQALSRDILAKQPHGHGPRNRLPAGPIRPIKKVGVRQMIGLNQLHKVGHELRLKPLGRGDHGFFGHIFL